MKILAGIPLFLMALLIWGLFLGGLPFAEAEEEGSAASNAEAPNGEDSSEEDEAQQILMSIESLLQPFVYDSIGARDPFAITDKNYFKITDQKSTKELPPIQAFSLEEMAIIGIVWNYRRPRAFVFLPNGKVHRVKVRDKIGNKDGYVAAIREGQVVVFEKESKGGKFVFVPKIKALSKGGSTSQSGRINQ